MLVRARAPLRLGLAGGGTDVSPFCDKYGGHVLNATINMYAYATLEPLDEGKVIFEASDIQKRFEADIRSEYKIEGDLVLHKAVYNRIIRDFLDGRPIALRMSTYCQAPPGSGLGSSSTVVVSMVKAYAEYLNLPLDEYEIAHLAFKIERQDANLDGGRQDQYAATFGGFNFTEFYGDDRVVVNPLRIKDWILSELESSLVLFYTDVSRDSEVIIKQQAQNISDAQDQAILAMHQIKDSAKSMKENLLKGNIDAFAEGLNDAWLAKKRTATKVTNPNLEAIYGAALNSGAKAGKISGAGGGGFFMFIVDPNKKMNVLRALKEYSGYSLECSFSKRGSQAWRIE